MDSEAPVALAPAPPFHTQYASVGLRFLAVVLDGLIFFVLFRLLRIFFPVNLPPPFVPGGSPLEFYREIMGKFMGPMILKGLFYLVITVCYKVLLVGKYGATIGKMALGLKVVKEDQSPVSYGTALIREFLVKDLIYGVLFFIAWLGYLWAFWDEKKQTWHDKIARTIVLKV